MEIYFDNVLIDEDCYTALSTNFALFSDNFYLGSTASNTYNLSIAKEAIKVQPETVTIYDDGELVATLVVDKIEENDVEYTYILTDKMVDLEFKYDASEIFNNENATLLEIAQDICNQAGIELATMDFRSYDKSISWNDNTRTAREYIGYIAELNGGYAQIGKDGKLYFIKQNTSSETTISIDDCADFNIGEKHVITRVVYEQGTLKYEYGDESGNTLYLSGDNVYITDRAEVKEIYNEIKGFEFYSFSTSNCPIDFNIMAGQIITFTDGLNNYPTIAGYDLTYNGDWYGGYNLDVATKKQEETQVIGTSEKIKDLSVKVDRESNKITQAIKEIDDQNQKISVVEQTVNELNSKISDIADITTSKESLNGTVSFEKVNQSEPIYVRIYPTGENISYLYPNTGLYPSEVLYPKVRTLRFTNTTEHEATTDTKYNNYRKYYSYDSVNDEYTLLVAGTDYTIGNTISGTIYQNTYVDYELPTDLLYYDEENYDEFILDYDAQSCVVNKRVGYNAEGTTYVLDAVETIEYEYPRIELTDGDYTIALLGYSSAYLFVRLMAQNIYTTQFATRAELNSEISQTESEINLSVDKKLTSYPTTTQMNSAINVTAQQINSEVSKKVGEDEVISKINQSAEAVGINADKIELSADDVLNLLAGNEINLSSKNITISSDCLKIDEKGDMVLTGNENVANIKIVLNTNANRYMEINPAKLVFTNGTTGNEILLYNAANGAWMQLNSGSKSIRILNDGDEFTRISLTDMINETMIETTGITTPSVTQTSKESKKKNITKYNEKALDIVRESEIYTYNFKGEQDKDKKHIGFVIGDEGGEYKTPEQVISNDREGIESYSMTSILWKAFQEYIEEKDEQIKQLQNEIKELKKESEN